MGTLADLKARIIAETNRDDLSDDLASDLNTVLASSIERYAPERWWFNEGRVTGTSFAPSSATLAVPSGVREVDELFLIVGAVRYPLRRRDVQDIDRKYSVAAIGQPTDYAFLGANIYVWPTPNLAYATLWNVIQDVTPAIDYSVAASANAWTSGAAADLIVAEAKVRLYQNYLSAVATDPRLALAMQQRDDAYSRLKGETNRRVATGRVRPSW